MCPNGIITSSVMTAVCFTISAPLSVSPLETGHVGSHQWGESLPQRHGLHPVGETAQPTRSESTRTHGNLHTYFPCHPQAPKDITMAHINPSELLDPKKSLRHPPAQRVKPLYSLTNRLLPLVQPWTSVQHLYKPPGALTCEHNNAEMWSAILRVWSALCAGEKSVLRKPKRVFYGWRKRQGSNKVRLKNCLTSPWGVCLHCWSICWVLRSRSKELQRE